VITSEKLEGQKTALSSPHRFRQMLRDMLLDWDTVQLVVSLCILLLLGLTPLFIDSSYYLGIVILTMIYAYVGLAWNISGGFAGQLLFGYLSFFGLGAYTTLMLNNHLAVSPWVGVPAGAIPAVLLGALISYLTLRYGLRGHYLGLFTLAVMVVLRILFSQWELAGGADGMWIGFTGESVSRMAFRGKTPYLYIALGLLLTCVMIHYLVYRSKFGKYLFAIRQDERAAAALGVNIPLYSTRAVLLSAALIGVGGGFYAVYTTLVDPPLVFGLDLTVEMLTAPLIGGIGTIVGPLLGALVNKPVVEITRGRLSGVRTGSSLIVYGGLLTVFILFLPHGVAGVLRRFHRMFRRYVTQDRR
jgi:branched-chain amino acid transport system permease protein